MEWYQDLLVNVLNSVSVGVEGGALGDLLKTPEQYSPELFRAMVTVHDVAVKPVTAIVLSIMFMLMLATASTKADGDRELGVRLVSMVMFKIAMVLLAAQASLQILKAISEAGVDIAKKANGVNVTTGDSFTPLGDQLSKKIGEMELMQCLFLVSLLLLPFIIGSLATVVLVVLVLLRFLQLDLMVAFASLPIAFLGHSETKQIAVGYLKAFAVTVISGVVLVLSVKLAQAVAPALLGDAYKKLASGDLVASIVSGYGALLGPPILLLLLFFTANGVSKKVLGEG